MRYWQTREHERTWRHHLHQLSMRVANLPLAACQILQHTQWLGRWQWPSKYHSNVNPPPSSSWFQLNVRPQNGNANKNVENAHATEANTQCVYMRNSKTEKSWHEDTKIRLVKACFWVRADGWTDVSIREAKPTAQTKQTWTSASTVESQLFVKIPKQQNVKVLGAPPGKFSAVNAGESKASKQWVRFILTHQKHILTTV